MLVTNSKISEILSGSTMHGQIFSDLFGTRLILHYLLPTKIYLGKLPTQKLLSRYPSISSLYSPLVNAIRQGNVRAFDLAMESGYTQLINRGTFLTIEKARSMVIRTLCRRVYAIVNSTRISMDTFKQALEFAGLEVDMEEVECMLAVLIYKVMRGFTMPDGAIMIH
jgi:hypothetical protein